jgi:hypothetical protein
MIRPPVINTGDLMPNFASGFRVVATAAQLLCLGCFCNLAAALFGVEIAGASDKPGSIVRVWPLKGGGPGGGDAFRILYRSTGVNGEPINVSAAIFIPPGAAPSGGRNVIAWAPDERRRRGLRAVADA